MNSRSHQPETPLMILSPPNLAEKFYADLSVVTALQKINRDKSASCFGIGKV